MAVAALLKGTKHVNKIHCFVNVLMTVFKKIKTFYQSYLYEKYIVEVVPVFHNKCCV